MIDENKNIALGEIYREHGIKGQCKFYSYSGDDQNLKEGQSYTLVSEEGQQKSVVIKEVFPFKRYYLIRFDIFETPEDMIPWRKAKLWMPTSQLDREDGERYDFEWQGFEVRDHQHKLIGKVKEVLHNPLPQFLVESSSGDHMIPYVEDWILNIDDENQVIVMELPEGLL